VLWLGVNLGVLGWPALLVVAAAGVLAAEPARDDEDEARRLVLGGKPVLGVLLELAPLAAAAGVREGVLPLVVVAVVAAPHAELLGVSYAPAMSPPATGVRPPLLLVLFAGIFLPPDGVGVRVGVRTSTAPFPLLRELALVHVLVLVLVLAWSGSKLPALPLLS